MPHIRNFFQGNPSAKPNSEVRICGKTATNPHIKTWAVFWVYDSNERDVVNFVCNV
jgi:hypothetical protein